MTIEFVGMINPAEWTETKLSVRGAVDIPQILRHARAHEDAGFDRVLLVHGPVSSDSLQLGAFIAANTERLGFMIAHRPGVMSPTIAARAFATLDQLSQGRVRLHAVSGVGADGPDGDHIVDKAARYARTDEYLQILKLAWTADQPFDFKGDYYDIRGGFSVIKPHQQPHVPISFGGSSDHAYRIGVKHADLYAIYGEPLALAGDQIARIRKEAADAGVAAPRISLSVRLILGATEELAWARAHRILAAIEANPEFGVNTPLGQLAARAGGTQRLLEIAAKADRYDRALWMPTATAAGAYGDTTALVGTPETVVAALLDYVDLGVTTFINRGYDPLNDTIDYGRWIIPEVRAEAKRRAAAAEEVAQAAE